MLIDVLADSHGFGPIGNDWGRHSAGQALNSLTGCDHYRGSFGQNPVGPSKLSANFAEAVAAYRRWWEANKDRLVFDKASRTWNTGG